MSHNCGFRLMLFIVFGTAAILSTGPKVFVFRNVVLAQTPETESASADSDQSSQTKKTDLGGGLELVETRTYRNGKLAACVRKYTRNGTLAMMHEFVPIAGTDITTYYRHGKAIVSEVIDKHGHMITVNDDTGTPVDMYERNHAGKTVPVSSNKLDQMKKVYKFVWESFAPIADAAQQGDEAKALQLVDDLIERATKGEPAIPSTAEKKTSK